MTNTPMTWQPISTAPIPIFDPQDVGTWSTDDLLLWCPHPLSGHVIGFYVNYIVPDSGSLVSGWYDDIGDEIAPTHWMPLPPRPGE